MEGGRVVMVGEGIVPGTRRLASHEDLTWYLTKIRSKEWIPNFFTSVPHLLSTKAEIVFDDSGWAWLEVGEEGSAYLPPVEYSKGFMLHSLITEIWSDLVGWVPTPYWVPEFMDWEYLYSPFAFQNMTGGKWEIFRKNSRKWPNRNGIATFRWERPDSREAEKLVGEWLESNNSETIYDVEAILNYLLNPEIRGYIGTVKSDKGGLLALLGWDRNWKFINFRYLIVRPGEPYLDEYCRLLFYREEPIHLDYLLINDGGTLGSPSLEQFKDKLNPLHKRKVYTWKRREY